MLALLCFCILNKKDIRRTSKMYIWKGSNMPDNLLDVSFRNNRKCEGIITFSFRVEFYHENQNVALFMPYQIHLMCPVDCFVWLFLRFVHQYYGVIVDNPFYLEVHNKDKKKGGFKNACIHVLQAWERIRARIIRIHR